MKKIIIIIYGLLLTLTLFNSPLWGQKQSEKALGADIYIKDGPLRFVNNSVPLAIPKNGTDTVTIYNKTDASYTVMNCLWVDNLKFSDQLLRASVGEYKYVFICPKYAGQWRFCIQNHEDVMCTVFVSCAADSTCLGCPSLTQPGMIILIILIMSVGVYLWIRRKPVPL